MDNQNLIKKITEKKEFSQLPKKDVEKIFEKFDNENYLDEEKIKKTRDLLRKVYSVFASQKILNKNILNKKSPEEILNKHLSTKERFENYKILYEKLLKDFTELTIIDLGAGINGLSYNFFPQNKKVNYIGIEAVGQLVDLMNYYFKQNEIKNARAIHESLFDLEKISDIIKKIKGKKIGFLFKVLDSLEMIEKNYSKKLLKGIVPLVDRVVVSFATKSLIAKKSFKVKRFWFENFVKDNFSLKDVFEIGTEKYFILKKR